MNRSAMNTPPAGLVLFQAPSRRQRLARRRTTVVTALVGLALASGILGAMAGAADPAPATGGPISYFPQ